MKSTTEVEFWVAERANNHIRGGSEWALYVRIGRAAPWVVQTWQSKPAASTADAAAALCMRCFEIWHSQLHIPPFDAEASIDLGRHLE